MGQDTLLQQNTVNIKKTQKPNSQNRKGHRRTTAREIAKTLWKLETCTVDNQNKDAEQVGCNCHQPNMNIPKIKKFLNFENNANFNKHAIWCAVQLNARGTTTVDKREKLINGDVNIKLTFLYTRK